MSAVDGIVLAAGRSTRMGQPKAQLELPSGRTFLEQAVHTLRDAGCRYVVAVVNDAEDWTARLADVAGAAVVINDQPKSEQIDSIRLGLAHLPDDAAAAVVLPVDIPRVKTETVRAVVDAFAQDQTPVIVPTHQGTPGHPVLFARAVFGELMADPLPRGAESIVEAHAADRTEIAVDDPGVLFDVDVPAEYRELRGGPSPPGSRD
jgi:molybdenum cofactor cytidylyltransferase